MKTDELLDAEKKLTRLTFEIETLSLQLRLMEQDLIQYSSSTNDAVLARFVQICDESTKEISETTTKLTALAKK